MEGNNFIIDLIASLKKAQSKKQVQSDAKNLGDIKVPLIGTLNKSKTKAQLKQDLASLNSTVNLTGKVNKKGIVTSVQQATKQAQTVANKNTIQVSMNLKKDKLINDIKVFGQQNSKLFKDVNMAAKYNSLLNNAKLATSGKEIQNLRLQLSAMRSEIKATNLSGLTLGDTFKKTFKRATELFTGTGGVMLLSQQMRQAWIEALNLDKAYTNLIKVQNELSRGDYPEYLERCNKKAQELATTQKGLIEGATEFSKSGYTLSESDALTEKSTILSNVGDMSASDSAKAIISGVQAYDIVDGYDDVIDKAGALIDKYNEIGNTASITTAEIAQGVQTVGSVFADANTSVDEFIALLAAGNRQYQDADALALGLRTAALRIRGCTTELEMMGEETDGVYTSTAKLADNIRGLTSINGNAGVEILEADGETFRSIYDIFLDISKVYQQMSDTDQSALLELISGKHRASAISATLNNMAEAQDIYKNSLEASGSAQREYDKYMKSSEASLNKFKASMTETYQSVISGDTVTGILNCGNATLQFANSLGLVESTLKGFVAIGIVKAITTLSTAFKASAIQASNYGKALNTVKNMSTMARGTTEYTNALKTLKAVSVGLSETQLKQVLASKALSDSDRIAILQTTGLTKAQARAKLAQMGLTQSTKAQTTANASATASTFSLSAAMKRLGASIKAAWMSNPIGITIMAVSVAIGTVTSVMSKYKESVEKASEATKEAINTFESISSEVESLEGKIAELNEQIKELDPITDAEDIENLKLETAELETQLGILKEKQRIASSDADKAAQKSLGMTEASRYKTEERESVYGGVEIGAAYVTKDEELLNAIEAYEEYKNKVDEANNALADMAKTGEYTENEWYEQEQIVSKYSEKMEDARSHANELATTLEEQKQGLNGNTESSKALLGTIDNAITKYDEWLNAINGTTEALEEQSEAEEKVSESAKKVTFDQAWADSFTSGNDAVKELGNNLLELAEQGRLTIETFNNADSTGYFKDLGILADEAVSKINKLADESKQLSSMSNQISAMAEALGAKLEDGFVGADTLSGFDVEVRGLDSWDRFQEILGSTASSYKECQEAANALATEWVNSSDFLAQLTEQNKEYYETQLQAMGVENYEEVIAYAQELNTAKGALAQASFNVATVTANEVQSLIDTGTYSEIAQQQIWNLVLAKQAEEGITLDTSADCQNLLSLAQNAGVNGDAITLLTQLLEIYNNLAAGTYGTNAQVINAVKNKAENLKNQINDIFANGVKGNTTEIDNRIKVSPSTKSSAKSAGKDTGKSYKEGLEEELNDLNNVISGVTGRIDDQIGVIRSQKEAALESINAQIDALNEQKSALEAEKKALEDARDAAVEALEEERDLRIEVIEQQKKQLEENIKLIDKQIKDKEKVIKGIQAEIDAMQDANEERKRQIDLQKAQYELERLQHQRTILLYSEEKGLHYVNDSKNIRDQKQKVDDAKLEIEIANKQKQIDLVEKEIDLLNEKKDAINEQIDLLDEQIDRINEFYDTEIEKTKKYYDEQIKAIDAQIESIDKQIEALQKQREQTEKYYESLIGNLEKSKSKYEELTEIVEKAELSAALKQLGIDEEALLNGSEEEFNKLKNAYMDIVTQLNSGNDEVLSSLQELSGYDGTAPAVLSDSNTELDEMNGKLDDSNQSVQSVNNSLGETATTTNDVASNVGELTSSLSEANSLVTEEQTAFNNLKQTITEVIEAIDQKTQAIQEEQNAVGTATGAEMANFELLKNKILEVKETLDSISNSVTTLDTTPVNNLTTAFQLLYNQLLLVASTLGAGMESQEEGAVSGITSAIQALNGISLEEGIIAQFDNLKTAIDSVTSAISGGGGESSEGEGSGGGSKGGESGGKGSEGEGGGGNSLTGAITEMGETATEVIGEPDAEGDGTVIGEFGAMKTAVNDVTSAIGSGDSEGGEGEGKGSGSEGESNNLIGSIVDLGETTEKTLGEPDGDGVIARFGQFKEVIAEADTHVHGISDGLDEIDGREVECTIKINIETSGNVPAYASGTTLGAMNLNSTEYNAKYSGNAHVAGTANVSGNWGVRKPGKSLVGELGQEIWVHSADGTFETVGDNGPEWIKTEKNDLIFNHLQTKELLDKGNIVKKGKAYADGSVEYSDGTIVRPDGVTLRPLQPGDRAYELQKAFEPLLKKIDGNLEYLTGNVMAEHNKQMEKWINQLNTTNVVNNNKPSINIGDIHITCPGVTSKEVAQQVGVELNNMFSGLHLDAMQQSMKR